MAEFQFIGTFWYSKHCCAEKSGRQLFNMPFTWLPIQNDSQWALSDQPPIFLQPVKSNELKLAKEHLLLNIKCYFDINSFVSCIQNGDLSKWRISESGYVNKCEPVSWEKGFHSTKMSWIEARDTCLWQSSKSYTLHISSDSIWPLVSLISFCNIQGVFFKKKLWRFR